MTNILKELEERYPESYEAWASAKGEPICERKASVPKAENRQKF